MTDIAGNRTLSSQWNETVQFYGNQNFLEYISVDDQLTSYTYSEFHYRVIQTANWFHSLGMALSTATDLETDGPWHWWPEQPQESGLYWCITGPMSHGGSLYWWDAEEEQWEHPAMAFRPSLFPRCREL